jgi:gamma-glutamyltranspeptidase/glutathione hydrolase
MIHYGLSQLDERFAELYHSRPEAYLLQLAEVMRAMQEYRSKRMDLLGNTTHISVLDRWGNAASLTATYGGASGYVVPGTGIATNNMLGELDLNPGGFYRWRENRRLTSMMAPSVVLREGHPWIVLGSGGSSRIRTAILQVLINMIIHKMHVRDAVAHPRLHWEDGLVNIEPGLLAREDSTVGTYQTRVWPHKSMFFGGVHTVVARSDGSLDGMGDTRRDGVIMSA